MKMADKGIAVDTEALGTDFGGPVIPTVGSRDKGTDALKAMILKVLQGAMGMVRVRRVCIMARTSTRPLKTLSSEIDSLCDADDADVAWRSFFRLAPSRWFAIKFLEHDADVLASLPRDSATNRLLDHAKTSCASKLTAVFGEDPESVLAERRYGCIHGICRTVTAHHRDQSHCRQRPHRQYPDPPFCWVCRSSRC